MNRSRVGAIVLRILYLYRGSPQRVFPIFVFVAVDIVLWGFLTRYLNSVSRADFNFVPALLGAVLLWDFLTRVMQQLTMALFEDVWTRNFLNFFATPLRVSEYLAGLLIVAVTTSLLSLVAMLALAQIAFGLSFFAYGVALAPFLMVLFVTGIALGVTASALVLRLGPASEWLIWPIPMLISPFAGVFYPIAVLPGWMQAVAMALPPSYVFEGMRAVVAGNPPPWDRLADESLLRLRVTAEAEAEFPFLRRVSRGEVHRLCRDHQPLRRGRRDRRDGLRLFRWTTDRPTGFTDDEIGALKRLTPFLGLAIKSASLGRIAATLVETYLGRDAGRRVLRGRIERGVADRIKTVLWFSDLRNYTRISETAPPEEIIPLLNDYADAVVSSIHEHDGDVLKLIGDGVLAIFPAEERSRACAAALDAARAAQEAVAA